MLFIDWEAQFSCTIAHCEKLRALYADVVETFYWVALPLTTQNALTQYKAAMAMLGARSRLGPSAAALGDYPPGLFFILSTGDEL